MYTIDLATLLDLLQEFHKNGSLYTELAPGTAGLREACRAWIELIDGQVVSCYVKNSRGETLFSGEDALRLLYRTGIRDWALRDEVPRAQAQRSEPSPFPALPVPNVSQLAPAISDPDVAVPTANSPGRIPRRVVEVDPYVLNTWPHLHRRVYVLVNGQNSSERIAAILSLYPHGIEHVRTVLADLEAMGVIMT